WWFNWKQGNQNITWETFERAFIKKFIPDLWEMLAPTEGEEQESHIYVLNENDAESKDGGKESVVEVMNNDREVMSSNELQQRLTQSEKRMKIVTDDEANNTNSLMSATAVKVQRSDEAMDNQTHAEDSLPTSPLPSHLRNSATGKIRELGFRDEPNEQPPPEWLDRQPLLSKPPDIGSHTVVAYIPKIKSRNKKVPLSATLSSQKPVTRRLTVASKFGTERNFLISCITESFCFKLWDPGGRLSYPSP
ncbi:hypothetical protein A2U01_0018405, partial [Trifolium medium]|nr:hypothetical protein [Trifolium medium]